MITNKKTTSSQTLTNAQYNDLKVKDWLLDAADNYDRNAIIAHFEKAIENRLEFAYIYNVKAMFAKQASKKEIANNFNPHQQSGSMILQIGKEKMMFFTSKHSIAQLYRDLMKDKIAKSRLKIKEVSEFIDEGFKLLAERYLAVIKNHFE